MEWIKYQIEQSVINNQPVLIEKKIGYSAANLVIAEAEAYNGEYTIEDDGFPVLPTTIIPGTYGRFMSNTGSYYIPNITVNERGLITEIGESYIGFASDKANGLMKAADYSYAMAGSLDWYVYSAQYNGGNLTISLGTFCNYFSHGYIGNGEHYAIFPRIYNVFAVDRDTGKLKPVEIAEMYCTRSSQTVNSYVVIKQEESHKSSNGLCYYVIQYDKKFSTSTSSM